MPGLSARIDALAREMPRRGDFHQSSAPGDPDAVEKRRGEPAAPVLAANSPRGSGSAHHEDAPTQIRSGCMTHRATSRGLLRASFLPAPNVERRPQPSESCTRRRSGCMVRATHAEEPEDLPCLPQVVGKSSGALSMHPLRSAPLAQRRSQKIKCRPRREAESAVRVVERTSAGTRDRETHYDDDNTRIRSTIPPSRGCRSR